MNPLSVIALILLLALWSFVAWVILKMFRSAAMHGQETNPPKSDQLRPFKRPEEKQRGDSLADEPRGTGRTEAAQLFRGP